jgi:branched-chain amino acid transport system ATP-binding protein
LAMLELKRLGAGYGRARILFDIDLELRAGEVAVLLGRNGAGKTTTLKAIMGLVRRDSGEVRFAGRRIDGLQPFEIARLGLGYVPEDRRIFTDLTVGENLEVGRQPPRPGVAAWTPERLFGLFPALAGMRGRQAARMSGGEQQMLTIARALMMRPRLLILDEPTLGLAPVILELLSKALEKLRQTTPITVLLGEQNVTFALPHADRVYVLEQARVVWEGPPQRFASEMGSAYL